MIYFLTVHWKSNKWINPQIEYVRRHTRADYRILAALDPTIPIVEHGKFAIALVTSIVNHAEKLNLLAGSACSNANSDDDWLVFIDSDCFPISDWVPKVEAYLRRRQLIAVRRDENVGDRQPHPCFCVTTVGLWKRIGGDWREGYQWNDAEGRPITDVGGNLMEQLERAGINWLPLLRSNRVDLHPLFFGVYDDMIYHHGAGSRFPVSRADHGRIAALLPAWRVRLLKKLRLYDRHFQRELGRTGRLSDELFEQLCRHPDFARRFL